MEDWAFFDCETEIVLDFEGVKRKEMIYYYVLSQPDSKCFRVSEYDIMIFLSRFTKKGEAEKIEKQIKDGLLLIRFEVDQNKLARVRWARNIRLER